MNMKWGRFESSLISPKFSSENYTNANKKDHKNKQPSALHILPTYTPFSRSHSNGNQTKWALPLITEFSRSSSLFLFLTCIDMYNWRLISLFASLFYTACASQFPRYALDFGLIVPNGSYAITASHCVQCSCGPGNLNMNCMPAPFAVSCSSMQCRNSNLMLGNFTAQLSSAGCNVTSCSYGGFVNGTILTTLSSNLQPRCPGPQQFPPLKAPPTTVIRDSNFAPAPAPQFDGSGSPAPGSGVIPSTTGSLPGLSPAGGPIGSTSGMNSAPSAASTLVNALASIPAAFLLFFIVNFLTSFSS